jgi:hypothetical protein
MSPHTLSQTPLSFREGESDGRFDSRSDSFASDRMLTPHAFGKTDSYSSFQSDRFYFTPLENSDDLLNGVDNSHEPQDFQVPALLDSYQDDNHRRYFWWNTPSPMHCNEYCSPEGSLMSSHSADYLSTRANNQSIFKRREDSAVDITAFPSPPNQSFLNDTIIQGTGYHAKETKDTFNCGSNSSTHQQLSPLAPQNLKGDPQRQAKVKTELCIHYLNGTPCPFGDKCNYAHGEEELKYTTLWELQQAGLINDVHTYRTHPCLSWVSTGAWYV